MNLTPFQASKVIDWVEHVLTNGGKRENMPRGIAAVDYWAHNLHLPFPKFDTEQPYTWEG